MSGVLPFEAFLEVLRARGYAIGLNEHFRLGALLARWDGANRAEFRDALAALLARSDDELRDIRQLFDDLYPASAPAAPFTAPRPPRRRLGPAVAVAAALLLALSLGAWQLHVGPFRVVTPISPTTAEPPPPPAAGGVNRGPVPIPPPEPPPPPAPSVFVDARYAAGTAALGFLAVLALFWRLKVRDERWAWGRDAWAAALRALPGPFQIDLALRGRPGALPRADVEDAATILGRVFATDAQARELDVRRSVSLTLRYGLMPHLVWAARRVTQPIVVLQDVGPDMGTWQGKVETLLADLGRQGVALQRYYFDADLRFVADRPYRGSTTLGAVLRRFSDAPVLVISTGLGLAAATESDDRWLDDLRKRPRRSWLTPVSDVRLWPPALTSIGLQAWPMTRIGLTAAARELAALDLDRSSHVRVRVSTEGRVTPDGIERVKRLASLVPHPTTALLDALRRRFAPDVSDAVLVYLLAEIGAAASSTIRLPEAEVQRCLNAVRRETPTLEREVRRFLLDTLRDSEPKPGSVAHLRWQAGVAVQEAQLAELEGSDPEHAVDALARLSRGPTWEEVGSLARLTVRTPSLTARMERAFGTRLGPGASGPPPPTGPLPHAGPAPRSWPGLRELVPAAVVTGVVLLAGAQLGAFPTRTVPNLADAYVLTMAPAAASGATALQITPAIPSAPQQVGLFRRAADDAMVSFGSPISLTANPVVIPLSDADLGSYFQVRGRTTEGGLALSDPLWVPSGRAVNVLIDAAPWANVTVSAADGRSQRGTTPYVAALDPGVYTLRLENGGLTPETTETIEVTSASTGFRFTMPGFDPNNTAASLAGRPQNP